MQRLALLTLMATLASCAPRPMLIGPPSSLPAKELRFSGGASWAKPVESSDLGVPQLDAALHLPVGPSFDLAVRAWSLGAGLQGRLFAASRDEGAGVDVMIAPLVGVSTLLDRKEENAEGLIGPIDVEFLVTAPVVIGFGAGVCTIYGGAEPAAHLQPDLFVLRAAAIAGVACPMGPPRIIAPELSFELPVVGGGDLRPENGYQPGDTRHPLLAQVVRLGLSISF